MKDKLIELLELCIEKGLAYNYSESQQIQVTKQHENGEGWIFYEFVGIYDFWDEKIRLRNINNLIEKVKKYKK